ncbi:hypothetical protein GPLA_1026 [Paraglaciecola polaris LMG 21857]|uniref:Uncharacterized protein n=1 Tax=Paraglaciecola polaris LMG 21857 TaxID=1129793 RepID=K6ZNS7_9ALTE|nr:hypothetical protein GPLA_1026 [Paraglaciecola polaris LMG 21857]
MFSLQTTLGIFIKIRTEPNYVIFWGGKCHDIAAKSTNSANDLSITKQFV